MSDYGLPELPKGRAYLTSKAHMDERDIDKYTIRGVPGFSRAQFLDHERSFGRHVLARDCWCNPQVVESPEALKPSYVHDGGSVELGGDDQPAKRPLHSISERTPDETFTRYYERVVGEAVGHASICWKNMAMAGVFDDAQAKGIVDALVEWIAGEWGDAHAKGFRAGVASVTMAGDPQEGKS